MSTQPNEGTQQKYRQRWPEIDVCKVERLKKLARETEILAMELVCEVYALSGSGHQEPPTPDDGDGLTNVSLRRHSNGHPAHPNPPALAAREGGGGGVSTHGGSGHQEPPTPIVDALVSVAHGAREIANGCDTLS